MRMKQIRPPFGDIRDVEMERFFLTLLLDGHLPLRTTRHIDRLLRMACTTDVHRAVLRPEFWLLVAMLIVGHLSIEAS